MKWPDRTGRIRVAALLSSALLASATVADYKESYQQALDALKTQNWGVMEHVLRLAIDEHAQPEGRVRRFGGYFPYYFLGLSLQELGRCEEALAEWRRSDAYGILAKSAASLHADLLSRRRECEEQLAAVVTRTEEANELLRRGLEQAKQLEARRSRSEIEQVWTQGDPSLGRRLEDARDSLDRIASDLESDPKLPDLVRAVEGLGNLESELGDLEADLAEAIDEATPKPEPGLDGALAGARSELARLDGEMRAFPGIDARANELEAVIATAQRDPTAAGLPSRLSTATRALQAATTPPPEQLRDAARAFIAGSYADVLEILEDTSQWTADRPRAHVCLLRSASLHGLYMLSDRVDETPLDEARWLLSGCLSLIDEIELSPEVLAPGFLELYREVTAAATDAG